MVEAADVEFPDSGIVGAFDRDSIANLPTKSLCEILSYDRALPINRELSPLVGRHNVLPKYSQLVFGVDCVLRKHILLVLVDASEPGRIGYLLYSGNAKEPIPVGDGQRLNDGRLVYHYHAICSSDILEITEG